MAGGADIRDRARAWRNRAMAPMTRRTGRCGKVAANYHRFVMDAFRIVHVLGCSQAIRLHQFAIRVAPLAGGGDVRRVYRRTWVTDREDVMGPMTIGAHGNPLVTLLPLFAMHTGVVE